MSIRCEHDLDMSRSLGEPDSVSVFTSGHIACAVREMCEHNRGILATELSAFRRWQDVLLGRDRPPKYRLKVWFGSADSGPWAGHKKPIVGID